jgi:hypothetical protein
MLAPVALLFLFSSAQSAPVSLPASAPASVPSTSALGRVGVTGIGAIRVGMSLEQASQASGLTFGSLAEDHPGQQVAYDDVNPDCYYRKIKGGPAGVLFMLVKHRIARVDVYDDRTVETIAGARIGDSEQRIRQLYPGRIQVEPHHYTDGHYLSYVPDEAKFKAFRIIFETDGERVLNFRAGRLPEVEYVEGCS